METTPTLEAGAAIRWKLRRLTWQALQSAWRRVRLLELAPYGLAATLILLSIYWLRRTNILIQGAYLMTHSPLGTPTVTQIGLVVPDIDKAALAWAGLLGVPVPNIIVTDTVDRAHTEYQGQSTPARARLAFFPLGPLTLELIEPAGEPSTWRDQLAAHGPSLHHIAFEIKGMPDRVKDLEAHGFSLLQRGDYQGGRYAYLDGLERFGAVVELLENDLPG